MILAHKIRLYPNNKQKTYFKKACGVARFAYNWALARWNERYEAGEKPNESELRKELNSIKKTEFPWMLEVTKCAPQQAIKDLGKAFSNFFKGKAGHPKLHRKFANDSFGISNDQCSVSGKSIRIPNLGKVRMAEELRFDGKIMNVTISRHADKWFVAIQVELQDYYPDSKSAGCENQAAGVDLGVKDLATVSDMAGSRKISGSKPLKKLKAKMRRLSKSLSRKQGASSGEKKSKNFAKAQKQLSRLHYRIGCIREDETHKLTTELAYHYPAIGIEDLNVKGMMANHKLAKAVSDMSFFEFRRQLEYKSGISGARIVVADKWYPSSKTCSCCGHKLDELKLSVREWECPKCGTHHDRDVNAATNLRNRALAAMA